jgi:hypothetical protein
MNKEYKPELILVCATDWLDQSRSNDSMRGRIVLLKWVDPDTKEILKFSTHEQWEDSRKENWKNPKKPNYAYGHFFHVQSVNDEIQQDYYKRALKMLNWYGDKPKLTIIDLKSEDSPIVAKETDTEEFQYLLKKRLGEEG